MGLSAEALRARSWVSAMIYAGRHCAAKARRLVSMFPVDSS